MNIVNEKNQSGKPLNKSEIISGTANPTPVAVSVSKLEKCYQDAAGGRQILDGLSLEVKGGQMVAITGPSGSGKSTLLNIIALIETADAGFVQLDGQQVADMGEPQTTLFRRRRIGFIYQFFNLIPTLTVYENIVLPLQLNGIADRGRADSLLKSTGLFERKNSYPDLLSGGEQQRVSVVRAIVHQPPIVLADEPTGNLDDESGGAVLDLLRTARDQGAAIIMVTHSETAASVADRRYVLSKGKLKVFSSAQMSLVR